MQRGGVGRCSRSATPMQICGKALSKSGLRLGPACVHDRRSTAAAALPFVIAQMRSPPQRGGRLDDNDELRPAAEDLGGRPRRERKLSGDVRLFRLRLLRDRDRKSVLSHRQRVCAAHAGLHDVWGRFFDAPAAAFSSAPTSTITDAAPDLCSRWALWPSER